MKRLIFLSLCLAALPAAADVRMPRESSKTYAEECGSCHIAYPATLLSAENWRAMMNGLDKHFGADARLDDKTRDEIATYLERNAARDRAKFGAASLRISDTRWFRHEHDEVPARAWSDAKVKSAANCGACHRRADSGDFEDDDAAIPALARRSQR